MNTGAQGCPTIVITTMPPGYPGGRPFITGNPHPAIERIVEPATIVKWRPSPIIIGYPHPVILIGPHPSASCAVGLKIGDTGRPPYITVFRIIHPLTMRTQSIIEVLVGNGYRTRLGRCLIPKRTQHQYGHNQRRNCYVAFHVQKFNCLQ